MRSFGAPRATELLFAICQTFLIGITVFVLSRKRLLVFVRILSVGENLLVAHKFDYVGQ
jgi:hypothetical protein